MTDFKEYNPKELELKDKHHLLLSSVAPRPIGFTTSKSKDGVLNLAPFSYHNAFSSNPPMVGISPAFSGRTGEAKNTHSCHLVNFMGIYFSGLIIHIFPSMEIHYLT